MNPVAEWMTAIGTALTGAGVVVLWRQLSLIREQGQLLAEQLAALREQGHLLTEQTKADHDRSRRQTAINYLFEWSRSLAQGPSLARKFAESLDDEQTRALVDEKPMRLRIEKKNIVLAVLTKTPDGGLEEDKARGEIILHEQEVSDIRWQLIRYLNSLESIFAAVRHKVADEKILVEQFGYLISPEKGHHLLKKFRDALGADGYPALHELESKLNDEWDRRIPRAPEKPDQRFYRS